MTWAMFNPVRNIADEINSLSAFRQVSVLSVKTTHVVCHSARHVQICEPVDQYICAQCFMGLY